MMLFLSILMMLVGASLTILLMSDRTNNWPVWVQIVLGIVAWVLFLGGGWSVSLPDESTIALLTFNIT